MGTALIAYLVSNPQVLETVAGEVVSLIRGHANVTDADKARLTDVITRLDTLAQHEQDIIDGK